MTGRIRSASGKAAAVLVASWLAGCSSAPYRIDDSVHSRSQGPRVQFIVLHYTSGDRDNALKTLSEDGVSAHYMVTADDPPVVYRLVDESRSAFHAGVSEWQGFTHLNNSSIGIEIVNTSRETAQGMRWEPYPPSQIDAVIALVKDLTQRYGVTPDHVIGHSDIAPQRKTDPGPQFPWARLAAAGLARWPDPGQVQAARQRLAGAVPDLAWFRQRLAQVGYGVPPGDALDEPLRRVLSAFQMHFRPSRFDGEPDLETAVLLSALTEEPASLLSRR